LVLWEADEPNHVEDVSGWVDIKLHALEAHVSQFESTMKAVEPAQMVAFRERIRHRLDDLGSRYGVESAEVFRLITDL
jgi:LmbE family N-acetylglucosaminyl deacetylase